MTPRSSRSTDGRRGNGAPKRNLEKTTMSNPHLPPEILDHILDTLHDEPKTLRDCCVVAKSWIPRARKHLFADIDFTSSQDLESWKKTFSDPSNSPAYYTHTLSVKYPHVVTAADVEDSGLIRTFSRVIDLSVDNSREGHDGSKVSLAPFHGFSPVLKSLRLVSNLFSHSQIIGLIRSLPLLEDLILIVSGSASNDDLDISGPPGATPPPSSPPLTGSLSLVLFKGIGPVTRQLLDLPNGLHFRKLRILWIREDDVQWINALVVECFDTLESIDVTNQLFGAIFLAPVLKSIPYSSLQLVCRTPRSTSQKRQNSETQGFGAQS